MHFYHFCVKKVRDKEKKTIGSSASWQTPLAHAWTLVVRELKPDNRGILQYLQSKYIWLPRELYDNT